MKTHRTLQWSKISILSVIIVVVFCVSLLPILYVSHYAHPTYDDYWFSAETYHAIQNGESIAASIYKTVKDIYTSWQGTYTAVAMFALQPGIFGQEYYFLTTYMMVGILCLGLGSLIHVVTKRWLGCPFSYSIILTCATLLCSIQFVPDIRQAFFWYNGSCYYTFFYALSLLLFASVLSYVFSQTYTVSAVWFVISFFLAIFIGGGNYSTALLSAELLMIIQVSLFLKRNKKWKGMLVILMVFLSGFMFSVMAPGNTTRAQTVQGMSAIKAVVFSMLYACVQIGQWTSLPQVVYVMFITPIVYLASRKCKCSFRYPLIALLSSFLLFASQYTPALYAMSDIGSGRQINIYYYSYYVLLMFWMFYGLGWISRRYPDAINAQVFVQIGQKHYIGILLLLLVMFGMGCLGNHISHMTSAATTISIIDGTASKYDQEYDEILKCIQDSDGVAILNNTETVPPFFGGLRLRGENEKFFCEKMAYYFELEEIVFLDD